MSFSGTILDPRFDTCTYSNKFYLEAVVSSNGSFTTAVSNSLLSPLEQNPIVHPMETVTT